MRISDLGIIGNCRSAALVSRDGSVVWSCLPDFDSPSIFAKILDEEKGGELAILAEPGAVVNQSYLDRTNVLSTRFSTKRGDFEVLDFMPVYTIEDSWCLAPELYRYIRVISGEPVVTIRYKPMLNYARFATVSMDFGEYIKSWTDKGDYHSVYTYSNLPHEALIEEKPVTLVHDSFILVSYHQKLVPVDTERVFAEMERTRVYWLNWVSRSGPFGNYDKEIVRSALVLKLLTYQKTGAVIAAVTTSLPEHPGGERNWDYRYCWVRDASMIINVLWDLRHRNSVRKFLRFLLNTMTRKADTIQILYGVRGEKDLTEETLEHLAGYMNSRPVRIGNAAYTQKQNDIYGILMDVIYTSFVHFPTTLPESEELWTTARYIMNTVEDNWHKPDRGIWEIRKGKRHFVFSKVLSWVAADRGVALARLLGRQDFIQPWIALREAIRADIEELGWNREKQAYTQSYGSSDLDASLLLLESVGYCEPCDPRYKSTVIACRSELCKDGLVYRYRNKDDFGTPQSAFVICTFWMIDALWKIGEKAAAMAMFEKMLSCTNHLGLLSEDIDFQTRELLGNFPQGYSHLALINTAMLINRADGDQSSFRFISP
ncbi:MAG: glycoside hydrolase family 15 protein [Spirochaetaceae bacterium]|nr:MAG: glycoside hydrolase family 15 protein [Spirochaetaceae bacterium]